MNLIFLKIGGSLITEKDKPFTENKKIIERIAKEIHETRIKKSFRLLLGNGGGSYPHVPAKKYRTKEGIINKNSKKGIAEVQDAASKLNRIIVRALIDSGENAISLQPSSVCLAKNSKIIEFYSRPLKILLKKDMLPVVYGDVVLDLMKGCTILSTEELFVFLAKKLNPKRVIFAGITEGVFTPLKITEVWRKHKKNKSLTGFTESPFKNSKVKVIPEINSKNYQKIRKILGGSAGIDVTGGMQHRVEKCLELAKIGIKSYIINGAKKNRIMNALLGKKVIGTVIR